MSRVATNYPPIRFGNGHAVASTNNNGLVNRQSSNTTNSRPFIVRSAAPPPVQKETVHACPLCNCEYKDPRVLPCTHTYCLNCIREKLINNTTLTCPKCQHQVQPFDDQLLSNLPRNLILSQEWRLTARPIPSTPTNKKPVAYQSTPSLPTTTTAAAAAAAAAAKPPPSSMASQQEKRRSVASEHAHDESAAQSHGIFSSKRSSINGSDESGSVQLPVVSSLVRIFSEATTPKPPAQTTKSRSSSVISAASKNDELVRIMEEATHRSQRSSTSSIVRPPVHNYETAYEQIAWDTIHEGPILSATSYHDQWHAATATHRPPSIVSSSSDQNSNVEHLRAVIASIQQHGAEKVPTISPPQIASRSSTTTHSIAEPDDDDDDGDDESQDGQRTPIQQSVYATIAPRQHIRQASDSESSRSEVHPPAISNFPIRSSIPPQAEEQKRSSRTPSGSSSTRRSSDRFPPPPQNIDNLDFTNNAGIKQRSVSSVSSRSSVYSDAPLPPPPPPLPLPPAAPFPMATDRFDPEIDLLPPTAAGLRTNRSSSRSNSHVTSGASTPVNRPPSVASERERNASRSAAPSEQHYLIPTATTNALNPAVTSRVDLLLSDQKRLERDIEEQMRRLKHDYDDIRSQIDRKESAIHHEVKSIAARLDEDITEHYHRKQKIYANLAADANNLGSELERLKANMNQNNKQQLWSNLEQIESNIRNIRQAVEQQKELRGALSFAEGRRAIAADTIGQITYTQIEPQQRYASTPSPPMNPPKPSSLPTATSVSYETEQLSSNISPYKYLKIDHLATLEPEAIAITENNKKILLGICNKLFILNEHGNVLKTIPLTPSIRGIAVSKKAQLHHIAYISHDETVSMIDIDSGQTLDSVKETDSSGESGTFLPLGIDTDNIRGDVFVCDYRNSCVIKFDDKLEFLNQWRIYNHSDQYDEARPKLISVYGQRLYMIIEHSCKPYYNQGIAYTFSLHICDANSGSIIKIIDADLLSTQRLRWPCSVQAISHDKCYILDTMTSGKYFNGQWQKHWSRVLEIGQDDSNVVTELFQLDSEAATMAMTKQNMIIAANGDILFVDLGFLRTNHINERRYENNGSDHNYQNLP